MNTISNLELEVQQEANTRSLEVIFLLMDRIQQNSIIDNISVLDALNNYVSLKFLRHRLKKQFFDYCTISENTYYTHFNRLTDQIKKAREIYYVAKRRDEAIRSN